MGNAGADGKGLQETIENQPEIRIGDFSLRYRSFNIYDAPKNIPSISKVFFFITSSVSSTYLV